MEMKNKIDILMFDKFKTVLGTTPWLKRLR